jgi:hypothetical protein
MMKIRVVDAGTIVLTPENDADGALLGMWSEQHPHRSSSAYSGGHTISLNIGFSEEPFYKGLWVVGLAHGPEEEDADKESGVWSIIGVFNTKRAAVDACTTDNHFVGPMMLNERLPDEPEPWQGAFYPLRPWAPPVGEEQPDA